MNGRYTVLASRIRQEISQLEQVVDRTERAMVAACNHPENQDLFSDAAALNLHDFYSGLERIFQQIANVVDDSIPAGHEWHRNLLNQMTVELPKIRPQVLSETCAQAIDEYLRFRHVVRSVYAFSFDAERIAVLVKNLRPSFEQVRRELSIFANFLLDQLADT